MAYWRTVASHSPCGIFLRCSEWQQRTNDGQRTFIFHVGRHLPTLIVWYLLQSLLLCMWVKPVTLHRFAEIQTRVKYDDGSTHNVWTSGTYLLSTPPIGRSQPKMIMDESHFISTIKTCHKKHISLVIAPHQLTGVRILITLLQAHHDIEDFIVTGRGLDHRCSFLQYSPQPCCISNERNASTCRCNATYLDDQEVELASQ